MKRFLMCLIVLLCSYAQAWECVAHKGYSNNKHCIEYVWDSSRGPYKEENSSNLRRDYFAKNMANLWMSVDFFSMFIDLEYSQSKEIIKSLKPQLQSEVLSAESVQKVLRRLQFNSHQGVVDVLEKLMLSLQVQESLVPVMGPIADWRPIFSQYILGEDSSDLFRAKKRAVKVVEIVTQLLEWQDQDEKKRRFSIFSYDSERTWNEYSNTFVGFEPAIDINHAPKVLGEYLNGIPILVGQLNQNMDILMSIAFKFTFDKLKSCMGESYNRYRSFVDDNHDRDYLFIKSDDYRDDTHVDIIRDTKNLISLWDFSSQRLLSLRENLIVSKKAIGQLRVMDPSVRQSFPILVRDLVHYPFTFNDWVSLLDNEDVVLGKDVLDAIGSLKLLAKEVHEISQRYGESSVVNFSEDLKLLIRGLLSSSGDESIYVERIDKKISELLAQVEFDLQRLEKSQSQESLQSSIYMKRFLKWLKVAKEVQAELNQIVPLVNACK